LRGQAAAVQSAAAALDQVSLAELMSGETPPADPARFRPERFA
jgi:hypothetical protein